MNLAADDEFLDRIRRAVLKVLPDAWAVYVFGSVARGDSGPSSDLDLAVPLPPGESRFPVWMKAQDVADAGRRSFPGGIFADTCGNLIQIYQPATK